MHFHRFFIQPVCVIPHPLIGNSLLQPIQCCILILSFNLILLQIITHFLCFTTWVIDFFSKQSLGEHVKVCLTTFKLSYGFTDLYSSIRCLSSCSQCSFTEFGYCIGLLSLEAWKGFQQGKTLVKSYKSATFI